ncbi:hypothetical protein BDD12DRAFT_735061, partial [Trichophaea hybrida]
MSLPVLDLSPFLHPTTSSVTVKRTAASALDTACRTHGFFYLTAHSIPIELESRVLSYARSFFLSAPAPKKLAISRRNPGNGGDGARGYQRLGENVTQGASDHHEAIDYYRPVSPELLDPEDPGKGWKLLHGPNLWPEDEGFREAFEEFWERLRTLG